MIVDEHFCFRPLNHSTFQGPLMIYECIRFIPGYHGRVESTTPCGCLRSNYSCMWCGTRDKKHAQRCALKNKGMSGTGVEVVRDVRKFRARDLSSCRTHKRLVRVRTLNPCRHPGSSKTVYPFSDFCKEVAQKLRKFRVRVRLSSQIHEPFGYAGSAPENT